MPASPMACAQICNPAPSARIMRLRIREMGCISSESRPRLSGWSENGSKKYAVAEPSEPSAKALTAPIRRYRSEERRVGKECRYRWSPDHLKKKETPWEYDDAFPIGIAVRGLLHDYKTEA